MEFRNLEHHDNYNFILSDKLDNSGISAMLRVKDEENTIRASIMSIIDFVDEVLVFDNQSTDNTLKIVDQLVLLYPDKIQRERYPFKVSLCGMEFAKTPENSIHSLAYYYNWCKSWCQYSYLLKWDADMIIPEERRSRWFEIRERVLDSDNIVYQPIGRLVILDKMRSFRDSKLDFHDPRIYPNTQDYRFLKSEKCYTERIGYQGEIFESCRENLNMIYSEAIDYFEIKDMDKNEFDHFGDKEVDLEVKQAREASRLEKVRNDESSYPQIKGDPFLNMILLE